MTFLSWYFNSASRGEATTIIKTTAIRVIIILLIYVLPHS
jgi:hypothetical protein